MINDIQRELNQGGVSDPFYRATRTNAYLHTAVCLILRYDTIRDTILSHVTGTKQFFGLRRNSWREASYDMYSYVKSLTKFL